MSATSLKVRTWIDKALHTNVWIAATQTADAAITACPDTPISTPEEATARRAAWESLGKAIGNTEAAVAPLRSRIQELRTELAARVQAVLKPANARVESVRRILGGWDAQARVRLEAQEAEQRKKETEAAYRTLVQAQDGADPDDTSHQALVFEPVGSTGIIGRPVTASDPFAAKPTEVVTTGATAPQTGATGKTRKTWLVDILDVEKTRAALISLPVGAKLQTALRVHEPTLRKLLATEMGPDMAVSAFPPGCVSVRSEDRAVRSRKATS